MARRSERQDVFPLTHPTRDERFVQRIYRLRTLGLGLGVLCVGSVLRLHDASIGWWVMLIGNGFAWPHAAWMLAHRNPSRDATKFDI